MEGITANELAGFGVGTLLLCATIAAPKIDALISASQRSSLGMCKKCGDLKIIACSRCKGVGSVRVVGPFSYSPVDDIYQLLGGSAGGSATKVKSLSCGNCQAKGHMCCPICSEVRRCIPRGRGLTRTLKPVTLVRDVAMAVPESASSPRWPTIMTEMTWSRNCDTVTATIGPAMYPTFFISSTISPHLNTSPSPLSFTNKPSSILLRTPNDKAALSLSQIKLYKHIS